MSERGATHFFVRIPATRPQGRGTCLLDSWFMIDLRFKSSGRGRGPAASPDRCHWTGMYETKPIRRAGQPGRSSHKQSQFRDGVHRAEQTQFQRAKAQGSNASNKPNSPGPIVRNKANLPPAPRCSRVQRRQTKPIRGCGAATGGTESAKQSQFPAGEQNRWGKPGPQTRFVAFGSPIHPTSTCDCAKQTQFSPTSRQPGSLGGESCETKPIGLRLHPATGSNGAKQSQFGQAGRRAGASEGERAKQSQFSFVGRTPWTRNPPPTRSGATGTVCRAHPF